ncbi:MAG TPA: ABC transporter permease [Terracidiphilus sp.]|jgi:putative ABC transport system permease protein|nr:ABC transporter permease [Terracidiphilus sp.]
MKLIEALKLALQSLWGNKMRTILTLIGVIMGVASVIMVLTLVQGAKRYISTRLSGYGADVFTITRQSSVIFTPEQYLKYQKRKILRIEDYQAVKAACGECSEVGALLSKSTHVVANGHSSDNTEVRGYTSTMLDLNNIDIALGRGFTPADEDHATKDVIVGYDIVDNLLGDGDPIGKEIRVDGVPYTIVGVGDRKGKTLGQSQDNWVALPITTYQQIYGYNDSVDIYARASGGAAVMEQAKDQARVLMRTRRHDAPGQPDDFEIETNDTFLDIANQLLGVFAWVVLGLGSIALVVGGVVIMNIMLVSVTERTREIGVRKAIGATKRTLLTQFTMEAVTLCAVGGILGILIGAVLTGIIYLLPIGLPATLSTMWVLTGFGVSCGIGLLFGIYPAWKAANLDPIEALRYE